MKPSGLVYGLVGFIQPLNIEFSHLSQLYRHLLQTFYQNTTNFLQNLVTLSVTRWELTPFFHCVYERHKESA